MAGVKPVKAGWYNVFRPWTLHGAVVPVLIGGAVALHDGKFDLPIFILIVIGGILLQSAANILNTYGDFKKGTDTVENETRSPELVTGKLEGAFIETAVAEQYAKNYPELCIAWAVPYEAEGSAIAIQKGNEAMLKAVNEVIANALADGTMADYIAEAGDLASDEGNVYEGQLDAEGKIQQ